jgi:hypothetical protein
MARTIDGASSTLDFSVTNEGTVFAFDLHTEAVKAWVSENVASAPWQWLGDRLVVDHRFGDFLAALLIGEGFACRG